jgi:guanylate kinase
MNVAHGKESLLFIFVGTSGSGRKTIANRIAKELDLLHIVSYTTRKARSSELDGRDYRFVTHEAFETMDKQGLFLETAEVDGEYYGLSRADVEGALSSPQHAYVILNAAGAELMKRLYRDRAVRLFIYVSKQSIQERLGGRMPYEVAERYLEHYSEEVAYRKHCEHVFDNIDLNRTYMSVKQAIEKLTLVT